MQDAAILGLELRKHYLSVLEELLHISSFCYYNGKIT